MTDDQDFDDLHHGYKDDPGVQAAKEQLANAIDAARQRARDEEAEAARADNERRANDPQYRRDFDRTECWPDCKPDEGYWGHTRNLGFCIEAPRPDVPDLDAYADLKGDLEEWAREALGYEYEFSASATAEKVVRWLADHPEVAARFAHTAPPGVLADNTNQETA